MRAVQRIVAILESFTAEKNSLTLQELADRIGLAKSTTFRIVQSLQRAGYLVRLQDQKYCLSFRLIRLAGLVNSTLSIREIARPITTQLADATKETVSIQTVSGRNRVCIDAVATSMSPLRNVTQPGQGMMARFTAAFTTTSGNSRTATGVTNCVQVVGPIDREDGYGFGFSGDATNNQIGVLHRRAGKVEVRHGFTEMGQGVHTVAMQTAVTELGIDPARIEVIVDTTRQLGFGQTTGSRGIRRRSVVSTSRKAAAWSEVTTPIARGNRGSAFLCAASKRPSLSSSARHAGWRSMALISEPKTSALPSRRT